jgi:hypothetical protein
MVVGVLMDRPIFLSRVVAIMFAVDSNCGKTRSKAQPE